MKKGQDQATDWTVCIVFISVLWHYW